MCGIFALLSNESKDNELLKNYSDKSSHRGPDSTKNLTVHSEHGNIYLFFHRLAINGLNDKSDQPMTLNSLNWITLMCNGEIYNFKEPAEKYNIELQTESDCEIIIHLYSKLPVETFIKELDGVFSFIIYDKNKSAFYIGHDPLGVRPLYWYTNDDNSEIGVSSEMKSLHGLSDNIQFYPPGTYSYYYMKTKKLHTYSYYKFNYPLIQDNDEGKIVKIIKDKLEKAVKKRLITDRPFGCLLSGGLDSSIVVSIISKFIDPEFIQTFAIGLEGSPDLAAAQKVADYIGTNHTNVVVSEEDMLNAIDSTIYQIESFDTTTIRASVPMFLLAKYIRDNTDIKVIFSGEGSDEASGSYLYFHKAPGPKEFQDECIRLLKDVRFFDVLRGDKTISGAGLELRVPFFDKEFLNYYMGINPELKIVRDGMEKYLLRKSFENDLPHDIVWRRKDGFSDGVSSHDRPWYEIIGEYSHLNHSLSEKDYYMSIFTRYYNGCEGIIPYQWMPKWVENVGDNPSGRLID